MSLLSSTPTFDPFISSVVFVILCGNSRTRPAHLLLALAAVVRQSASDLDRYCFLVGVMNSFVSSSDALYNNRTHTHLKYDACHDEI